MVNERNVAALTRELRRAWDGEFGVGITDADVSGLAERLSALGVLYNAVNLNPSTLLRPSCSRWPRRVVPSQAMLTSIGTLPYHRNRLLDTTGTTP
jgi:hypothetical protein